MSQAISMPPDPELGGGQGGPADDRPNHPVMTSNQPLQGESNFGDSSGSLFTIYSKAAEDEDIKMVERWQKDADGILIFTGLFSAAVAALLAVTVQDLRRNSQDISAFYLGNIYQVLADSNVTHSSTPFPVAKLPSFSPSRYTVWVNSLWFLSLVMSLSCALWATSLHQWARRYLRRSQPSRCNPEKRARMRAFFAAGVDNMHIPWAVEGLPTLLHLSLFLFFGGLAIFLFDVDREVFSYVVWWIGLFCLVYGMITLLPLIRQDSPYNSPLSTPAWFLTIMTSLSFSSLITILGLIIVAPCYCCCCVNVWHIIKACIRGLWKRHRRRLGGVEKVAEEAVSKRLSKIDISILDWTITSLGDDDSLKNFFEAIPGFLNSKLVKHLEGNIPEELVKKYGDALNGFLDRTWTSNSVNDVEKLRRVDIATTAIGLTRDFSGLFIKRGELPPQVTMARILSSVQERDDRWITVAARVFDLSEQELRENIGLGDDSVLLAVLIHVTRRYLHPDIYWYSFIPELGGLPIFNIRNTLPRLQHDFCTLWNEILQKARKQGHHSTTVRVLYWIRHHYIALHQGTDAAPTVFSASTPRNDDVLYYPAAYPQCNLASHRPGSIAQQPALSPPQADADNTAERQAEQVKNVLELPSTSNPTTTSEIGVTSHGPDTTRPTSPVHSGSRPIAFVAATSATPQDITSTAMSSPPLKGSEHHDIVAPSAEPGTSQILFTASTHAPAPILAPIPTSPPNTQSESYNPGVTSVRVSISSHFLPPSIGSSIPASRPTGNATLPHLHARGLVNTGNICFVNAVLQLFINLPPFWNLFRELGDQMGHRGPGVPETGGGATPLVDATMRFLKEFLVQELPPTQEQSQPATGGTSRADEGRKDNNVIDSFEPTYIYDAMKEKRQLKPLLDSQQQDAEEFLRLYLDSIDEELSVLPASVSGRQSAGATLEVEDREVSQSGQTEVGKDGFIANFVESPITRIFGGEFCSLLRSPNKPDVVTTEDWRSLHLDVLPDSVLTVQDALMRIFQSQSMQHGPSGSSDSDASQQMLIEALPPVLVLHLKRFRYDAAAGGVVKISKPVQFSPVLEIPFDVMVPSAGQPAKSAHYTLCGVLYHHGESAGGGHYTVDVLHPNGDGDARKVWLHIDDEAVSTVRDEDVFAEHGIGSTERAADERCAYLLFYCRTSPKDTS